MFTSVVGRLIWKEYRVQRGLWILLFGLLMAMQIILRLAFFTNLSGRSSLGASHDELWATWAMWFVAFAAHVGFLVASIAITFAGEREEQTWDRLVQLSPSPWAVLLAKIGTCVAGSLLLYFCGALVAILLGRSSPDDPYSGHQLLFTNHSITLDLAARLAIMFGLLVWCIFGSLLSQRVLTSIPMMAVGWVITGWVPMALFVTILAAFPMDSGAGIDRWIVVASFLLVAVCMIAVDLRLGYQWAEGKQFNFQGLSGYWEFFGRIWNAILDRSEQASRIPRGIEPENAEYRPWQRLVWQERQRSRIARWLVIAICAFVLAVNDTQVDSPIEFGVPLPQDVVVCLLALAMGVLSYRSDGEGQPVRFLANHGTSPSVIWKAKQGVWMTRAFVILTFLLALTALRDSKLTTYPMAMIERHFWLTLASYGSGQLAAMLLKRAMLAAITGATAAGILFLWLEMMRSLKLPLWWSLGIPAIAPLLATWLHARAWLLDDSTRWHRVRLTVVLAGFPLFVCSIVASYRVLEITRFETSWRHRPVFAGYHERYYQYEKGHLLLVTDPTLQPPTRLQKGDPVPAISKELVTRARLLTIGTSPIQIPSTSVSDRQLADEVVGAFEKPGVALHLPFDQPNHLFPVPAFEKLSALLLERARSELRANETKSALDTCLSHLKMCQSMASGLFAPCWQAGAEAERRSLELLVEWSNHPQVDFTEVHGAIAEIQDLDRKFPSASASIIDEFEEAKRKSIIEQYSRHYGGTAVGWRRVWLQLPWETSRRHELWNIESLFHRAHLSYLENSITAGNSVSARYMFWPTQGPVENLTPVGGNYLSALAEIQGTTWGAEVALSGDRSEYVRDRYTAMKATLTRLGVIAYRKQYGKMPPDLDAVIGIVRQSNFLDPWSSGRFDYRTNAIYSQGNSPRTVDSQRQEGTNQPPRESSRFVFAIPPTVTAPAKDPIPEGGSRGDDSHQQNHQAHQFDSP